MKFAKITAKTSLPICDWIQDDPGPEISPSGRDSKTTWETIATYPEDGMGFQIVWATWRSEDGSEQEGWSLVLGGTYLLPFNPIPEFASVGNLSQLSSGPEGRSADGGQVETIKVSAMGIAEDRSRMSLQEKLSSAWFSGGLPPWFSGVPSLLFPLHFAKMATGFEGFYRFSAFEKDKRICPKTGDFSPGTFAAPYSEIPLVPSGFAAVGRYALPSPFPHPFVFRNVPTARTHYEIGAAQPNFGQAGGGVEAFFRFGAVNQSGSPHVIRES